MIYRITSILIILLLYPLYSSNITVINIDGSAQVKKEGSRKWETLKKGAVIEDNDQIQTAFKGRCEIKSGIGNEIVLGSSSRILVSVISRVESGVEVGVSLLSGSVYSRMTNRKGYSIFTSSAKGITDAAVFNCTVDEITGMTGFHVLRGEIAVQNISIQGTEVVRSGETVTISPSTPPSLPRRITTQQMAVLTRFYGSDFVNKEIRESGLELESAVSSARSAVPVEIKPATAQPSLTPTSDKSHAGTSTAGRTEKTDATAGSRQKGSSVTGFNRDNVDKRIAAYITEKYSMFETPLPQEPLNQYKYRLNLHVGGFQLDGILYPEFALRQAFYWKNGNIAVHLPIVPDQGASPSLQVGSLRAVLDKIYSAEYHYGDYWIKAGRLNGLTLGHGMLVRNYSNCAMADNIDNLSVSAGVDGYFDHLSLFTSSIADVHLSALNYYSDDPLKRYDVVVVLSRAASPNTARGDYGFMANEMESTLPSDSVPKTPTITGFELGGTIKLLRDRPYEFDLRLAYSGLLDVNSGSLIGYGLLLPAFSAIIGKSSFDAELFMAGNRFIRSLWSNFYEDMHYSFRRNDAGVITGANALINEIEKRKNTVGTRLALSLSPLKGTAVSIDWEKVMLNFDRDSLSSGRIKVQGKNDGHMEMSLQIGDGFTLWPRLLWLRLHYRIDRIGYFDGGRFDPFTPNPFTSIGFDASIRVRRNINLNISWGRFYYDYNGNYTADENEKVDGMRTGFSMGF